MADKKKNKENQQQILITGEKSKDEETHEAVIEFSNRDEKQIEAEIAGETVKEYFYQFKQGNRTVTGLSIKGVNELIRRIGNVHVSEPKVTEKKDSYEVKVLVKDVLNNIETWGIAEQSKKAIYGPGEDPFALQKAYSKARRNALRQLIPESLVSKSYEKWQKEQEQLKKDAKSFMSSN